MAPHNFGNFKLLHPMNPPACEDAIESPHTPTPGLQLTVRGLNRSNPTAAKLNLEHILEELATAGNDLRDTVRLIVPPDTSWDSLDYVYVALKGPLQESPRPDVLEVVQDSLNKVPGISADWSISKGGDRGRQLTFDASASSGSVSVAELQKELEGIFEKRKHSIQLIWSPDNSSCISFTFTSFEVVRYYLQHPPVIKGISFYGKQPKFIQPHWGTEIAVGSLGELAGARAIIDEYLEKRYGGSVQDPVVCFSQMAADEAYYTAVLCSPELAAQAIMDTFDTFKGLEHIVSPIQPNFLFTSNTLSLPFNNWYTTTATQDSPMVHTAPGQYATEDRWSLIHDG
jgi:hypothetical protein